MGQQEVYDFLIKNPDHWYTSKEISEQLIVSIGSVTMSLKKLRKTNIIKFRNTGKRNTFQYMVQSEPVKLIERKSPLLETIHPEPTRVKVKIKPKIVHQHTYLGGQTFYGVIRPKDEVDAMERQRESEAMERMVQDSTPSRKAPRKTLLKKKVRTTVRKALKPVKTKKAGKIVRKAKPVKAKRR